MAAMASRLTGRGIQFSAYTRERIINLMEQGYNCHQIRDFLLNDDNLSVSLGGIYKFVRKMKKSQMPKHERLRDKKHTGRPSSLKNFQLEQIKKLIDQTISKNPEVTARELQREAEQMGFAISLTAVKNIR